MNETFLVKTEAYQGPLDVLLSLIEKRKLLINEISLSKITDDYLAFIDRNENFSLKNNAHFILIAATLLLIKSKSLLPGINLTDDEEQSIEELETRLKIYKKMKEVEPWIQENFGKKPCYRKQESKNLEIKFSPAKNISIDSLVDSMKNVINSLPKIEKIPKHTVRKIISLEESIVNLCNKVKQNMSLSFRDFSRADKEEKINVVVNFLAMLELIKQGVISVIQQKEYGDIEMHTSEIDIPNYS